MVHTARAIRVFVSQGTVFYETYGTLEEKGGIIGLRMDMAV